jgi:hypothetical protein
MFLAFFQKIKFLTRPDLKHHRGERGGNAPDLPGRNRETEVSLNFMDFEIPLLKALVKLGGKAKPAK